MVHSPSDVVKVAADKPIGPRYQDHFVARIHASAMIVSPNTNAGSQRAGAAPPTWCHIVERGFASVNARFRPSNGTSLLTMA